MLLLKSTEKIRILLQTAIETPSVNSDLKRRIQDAIDCEGIPFDLLQSLCPLIRDGGEAGPWIHEVCQGSKLILNPPPERKRSPELLNRLKQLQHQVDEVAYQKMVQSVSLGDNEDRSFNLLPTLRLQLSFGAHVLLTMFVFYLLGSYATHYFSDKPGFRALGGAAGLTFGLILETTLFMIRSVPLKNFNLEGNSDKEKQS
eukprot:g8613.t1